MSGTLINDAGRVAEVLPLVETALSRLRAQLDDLTQSIAMFRAEAMPALPEAVELLAWSDERVAVLRENRGHSKVALLETLNALPGRTLTLSALKNAKARLRDRINAPAPGETAPPASARFEWTPERKALLKEMRDGGKTYLAIGRAMGISKSAAVAQGGRLGCSGTRGIARQADVAQGAATPEPVQAAAAAERVPPVALELPRAIPRMEPTALPPVATPAAGTPPVVADRGALLREAYARSQAQKGAEMPAEPAKPPKQVVADIDQIRGFLARKGHVLEPFDIDAVNTICRRIGAPPFVLGEQATAERASKWAAGHRMPVAAPLFIINAERKKLGLPVFIVKGESA